MKNGKKIGSLKTNVSYLISTCQILAFLYPLERSFNNHGYNLIFMEFDFTQINRTLKKVKEGIGSELAIKRSVD